MLLFLVPVPNQIILRTELRWLKFPKNPVSVVTGNSVISAVSRCDAKQQGIGDMLAAAERGPVLNLAYPGQGFDESVGYAGQAIRANIHVPLVLFLSTFALEARFTLSFQSQLFFRLAAGSLQTTSVFDRLAGGVFVSSLADPRNTAFTYKGRQYPDYEGIKAKYFTSEQRVMGCPETLGRDRAFIEANYWNNYARFGVEPANLADLVTLARRSSDKSPFLVVLLPIDFGDIASLDPNLAAMIQISTLQLVQKIRARSVPLLDLTSVEPSEHFIERWCACGHLSDSGREDVAARVYVELIRLKRRALRALQ